MTDQKHTVHVEFDIDSKGAARSVGEVAKEFKKAQKATGSTPEGQQKQSRFAKQQANTEKQAHRQRVKAIKDEIKEVQKLTKELQKQNKELDRKIQKEKQAVAAYRREHGVSGFGRGIREGFDFQGPPSARGIGRGLAGAARTGIGLAGSGLMSLLSMPISAVGSDYQAYFSYMRQMASMSGFAKGSPFGIGARIGTGPGGSLTDNFTKGLTRLGYAPEEQIGIASQFARATGSLNNTELGGAASRLLGVDTGDTAELMKTIRQGAGGFSDKEKHEFQKILEAGVKGGFKAIMPEYLSGIQTLTQRAGVGLGGTTSGLPYAQLLSLFQRNGAAGLKGARGVGVVGALEDMIKTPGGGEEGQALALRTLGFGKLQGGTSYYEAIKQQEKGLQGGAGMVKQMFNTADYAAGGNQEQANLMLKAMTGGRLGVNQIEEIRKAMGAGKSTEEINKMLKDMTASELDVLKDIDSKLGGDFGDFLKAGQRSAEIAKADIQRGAKYAASLESIQNELVKFIDEMAPAIAKGLTALAEFAKDAEPLLDSMSEGINIIADFFTDKETSADKTAENAAVGQRLMNVGAQQFSQAADIYNPLLSSPTLTPEQIDQLKSVPAMLRVSERNTAMGGRRAGVDVSETIASTENILNNILEVLIEQRNLHVRGITGQIDTQAEQTAALRALGITVPGTPRNVIDRTGGRR